MVLFYHYAVISLELHKKVTSLTQWFLSMHVYNRVYYMKLFFISDCDNDTLLIQAINNGPTCHLEKYSCFGDEVFSFYKLETIINKRKKQSKDDSYTNYLLNEGNKEIAKKIAEEANELAISAVSNDGRILEEAADLMYHLQVLLVANKLTLNNLEKVLSKRNK